MVLNPGIGCILGSGAGAGMARVRGWVLDYACAGPHKDRSIRVCVCQGDNQHHDDSRQPMPNLLSDLYTKAVPPKICKRSGE